MGYNLYHNIINFISTHSNLYIKDYLMAWHVHSHAYYNCESNWFTMYGCFKFHCNLPPWPWLSMQTKLQHYINGRIDGILHKRNAVFPKCILLMYWQRWVWRYKRYQSHVRTFALCAILFFPLASLCISDYQISG